ncbi:unnamed protein product [Rhizoctonia solani]|uniref:Uncharacterized protein n=1 Tax=Rhizoctonia solani TaxID=456999 RepID=A0A8H3GS61_9AGAM|nr:unnamed protein product [Rhizoctonia solani]
MAAPTILSLPHQAMLANNRPPTTSWPSEAISSNGTATEISQPSPLKLREDIQKVTIEGFRTLGIVSTFVAGVEAQCLGLISDVSGHPRLSEAASALLLVGLSLTAFGAALSLLSARWFELLTGKELDLLRDRVMAARIKSRNHIDDIYVASASGQVEKPQDVYYESGPTWKDHLVARAVGSTTMIVFCGFYTFVVGMTIYGWIAHSVVAAAVNTFVAMLGTALIVIMHLNFDAKAVLNLMRFERVRI